VHKFEIEIFGKAGSLNLNKWFLYLLLSFWTWEHW